MNMQRWNSDYMNVYKYMFLLVYFHHVNCFILDTMYSRRNKFKLTKSTTSISSSSVNDHHMNIGDDYKEISNIKITNQISINENIEAYISSLMKPISTKKIV